MAVSFGELSFGEVLRDLRTRAGLTQEQLAERAGLSVDGVSLLERGGRRRPQRHTVLRLADALGLAADTRDGFLTVARPGGAVLSTLRSLPSPATVFVGRTAELGTLDDLLSRPSPRLVTLTGPAGVGKTRLALEGARRHAEAYPDGVVFVSLAQVRDPALVAAELARSLGIRESPGRTPAEAVLHLLRPRRVLLVLDTFEHLLDAAGLVQHLLEECPLVKALVTSRSPLHLRGEQQLRVPTLALPAGGTAGELRSVPAIALFTGRARAVAAEFTLTDDNAATVLAVCARLDGLPLALELAAAWLRVLSPAALADRLDERLALLVGGYRDLPERQQTLSDALRWSYELLSAPQQAYFEGLSVFVDGCTAAAAEAVLGASLADLTALVDSSLLAVERDRFRMLETVREFAAGLLSDTPAARRRHAEYYLAFARGAELVGPEETAWKSRLSDEDANLRTAAQWALDEADVELCLAYAHALWRYWATRGQLTAGSAWLEGVLRLVAGASPPVDPLRRAELLHWAGNLARGRGDLARAAELYSRSAAMGPELGDELIVAAALHGLGIVRHEQGELSEADRLYGEVLRIGDRHGSRYSRAYVLKSLGDLRLAAGSLEGARDSYDGSLAAFEELGHAWGAAQALTGLADVARAQGRLDEALAKYTLSLEVIGSTGDPIVIAGALDGLGRALCASGSLVDAVRLLAAASAVRDRVDAPRPADGEAAVAAALSSMHQSLGQAAFADAWADGASLPLDGAVSAVTLRW